MNDVIITSENEIHFQFPMTEEQLGKLCAYASKLSDGNLED